MSVGAASGRALVGPREPHRDVLRAEPESQHRPTEVVPVDDEARAASAGGEGRDGERRHGRRRLDQDHAVAARAAKQSPEERGRLSRRIPRGESEERGVPQAVSRPACGRGERVHADARVCGHLRRQLGLAMADWLREP